MNRAHKLGTGLICLVMVTLPFLSSGSALADIGGWELLNQYGFEYAQSALLRLSTPSEDAFYTVSVHQDGADSAQIMHKSTDGGYTWETLARIQAEPSFCGMFHFIHMYMAIHFYDDLTGIRGGFGAKDWCFDLLPEPLCLACVFLMGTEAQYTEDGGLTWTPAKLIDVPVNGSFNDFYMFDDGWGYAAGQSGTFAYTMDGGVTWTGLGNPDISLEEWEVKVHDIHFLNHDVGYVTTGLYDEDLAPPVSAAENGDPQEIIDWMLHQARMLRDPPYRLAYRQSLPDNGRKGAYGKILKTTDGGHNWTVIYENEKRAFYKVWFINEERGFAIGESYKGWEKPLYILIKTTDGGETWEQVDLPDWQDIPGMFSEYWLFDIKFMSDRLGFIIGDGQGFPLGRTFILYTVDGGDSWELDPFDEGQYDPLDIQFVGRDAYVIGQGFLSVKYTGVNSAPIADAGEDQEVELGAVVALDGAGSYDIEGDPLAYLWNQTGGANMNLSTYTEANSTFTATELGAFTFALQVSDSESTSDPDEVTITVFEAGNDDTTDDDVADDDLADDDIGDDDDLADDDVVPGNDNDDDSDGCGC